MAFVYWSSSDYGLKPGPTNEAWGQCYKFFSVRDLQIFVLSYSACQTTPEKNYQLQTL